MLAQEQLRHRQCLPPYPSPLGGILLAAKLSNQGEMYGIPPFELESYPIFVACIRMAFECQRWKLDEVVAQQWGMYYIVQFYVHPSVIRAKSYGKVTVICDGGGSPVFKT